MPLAACRAQRLLCFGGGDSGGLQGFLGGGGGSLGHSEDGTRGVGITDLGHPDPPKTQTLQNKFWFVNLSMRDYSSKLEPAPQSQLPLLQIFPTSTEATGKYCSALPAHIFTSDLISPKEGVWAKVVRINPESGPRLLTKADCFRPEKNQAFTLLFLRPFPSPETHLLGPPDGAKPRFKHAPTLRTSSTEFKPHSRQSGCHLARRDGALCGELGRNTPAWADTRALARADRHPKEPGSRCTTARVAACSCLRPNARTSAGTHLRNSPALHTPAPRAGAGVAPTGVRTGASTHRSQHRGMRPRALLVRPRAHARPDKVGGETAKQWAAQARGEACGQGRRARWSSERREPRAWVRDPTVHGGRSARGGGARGLSAAVCTLGQYAGGGSAQRWAARGSRRRCAQRASGWRARWGSVRGGSVDRFQKRKRRSQHDYYIRHAAAIKAVSHCVYNLLPPTISRPSSPFMASPVLPNFFRADRFKTYETLRNTLWPADDNLAKGDDEPPALSSRTETLIPEDQWLFPSKKSGSDAMDVDDTDTDGDFDGEIEGEDPNNGEDGEGGDEGTDGDFDGEIEGEDPNNGEDGEGGDEGPAEIRYINLKAHEVFAVGKLRAEVDLRGEKATFVVRHEYVLFMKHALRRLSHPPNDSFRGRFFVTGKSLGCYYFLFYLLALGQSVFFLDAPDSVLYFSRDGVQKTRQTLDTDDVTREALRNSWVLIDVDDNTNWKPPLIVNSARCVIWTSSPRESRSTFFTKRFGAEVWYMKSWSLKEIAAVTARLDIEHDEVFSRLDAGGPVARSLWGGTPVPTRQTIDVAIAGVIQANLFNFTPMDVQAGVKPIHRVYLVEPLVVVDESGRRRLQRTDYSAEFISVNIFHRVLQIAQENLEKVQSQLAAALNTSTTRSVAGKVFEGIMHRTLTRGMQLPAIFGPDTVAGTLMLIGKAEDFRVADTNDIAKKRPLYLRPESLNFAAVDAILVTRKKLGLIQVSLGSSHSRHFGTMLRIMSRLRRGARVDVGRLGEVIYCLVGINPERVQELVAEANRTLANLKTLDAQELCKELGIRHTQIACTRLSTFQVLGYTFDYKQGFAESPVKCERARSTIIDQSINAFNSTFGNIGVVLGVIDFWEAQFLSSDDVAENPVGEKTLAKYYLEVDISNLMKRAMAIRLTLQRAGIV
ncbi:hypothetical protein GGX14DRAFT_386840 [Mycena pura]|uniref:Uncharacterized protein n=1 Tax=Mycena pura TaxID=153505 RepID=A0AAD6YMJ2_9AGAR|nr:hypothetical protein GGX14DRAFT_386840 [Mycena pura]